MFVRQFARGTDFQSHTKFQNLNLTKRLMSMSKKDWEELTEEVFNDLFKNSAIKRTNFSGLKRNIKFLKQ